MLHTLTPAQNLAIREIIYNVSRRYPNRLAKKVYKPLSVHFFKKYWEQLWRFLQENSAFMLEHLNGETHTNTKNKYCRLFLSPEEHLESMNTSLKGEKKLSEEDILSLLPENLREKGKQFLQFLKTVPSIDWDEKGKVIIDRNI